ncbi:hypothetical protein IW140_000455 [Coemansia sp. RSA 1813]|nr:hypothetical protein LPJ74_002492 [Coemansia sp. RSA 1843]KAJ2092793.1 hypothetical protein IW138_000888 [Coemansia sp. RSA 986]KAJ2217707.1 hypothetical protein EV179_000192 [Coemansia sp. RSA 487]KAJ2573056.1 hypothetical protein IW140_000455 [Coemansia sp. RSA 1813]
MSNTAVQQLAVKRIASYQKYSAPLVLLSDTAQQTALPLLEALVRESLHRGLSVVVVCMESKPSANIAALSNVSIVDYRPTLDQITGSMGNDRLIDFVKLKQTIQQAMALKEHASAIVQHQSTDGGLDGNSSSNHDKEVIGNVLVAFDSIEMLLRTSTVETLFLLRTIRQDVSKRSSSRVLARFPRDVLQQRADTDSTIQRSSAPPLHNTLSSVADAVIDVYPLDALPSWMPGWYSNEEATPFVSLKHNDSRRGLLRMEHRKQSGKIGLEVASFEIDERLLPVFWVIEISSSAAIAPQDLPFQQHTSQKPKHDQQGSCKGGSGLDSAKPAKAPQAQHQPDPTDGLSFNLKLTAKQRKEKANVELPYLEAQLADSSISPDSRNPGGGEIHYQLDETDDWDDEDDLDDDLEI